MRGGFGKEAVFVFGKVVVFVFVRGRHLGKGRE